MPNERSWIPQNLFTPWEQHYFGSRMLSHNVFSEDHDLIVPDSENSNWIYPDREIVRSIAEKFGKIPQVKSICVQFGSGEITIWTLLGSYDRKAREKVYKKELETCRAFGVYDFDFRTSSVDLISPQELIQAGCREIYRRH